MSEPTYQLLEMVAGDGKVVETGIRCLSCRSISSNQNDVRNRYCGNCHRFHEGEENLPVPAPKVPQVLCGCLTSYGWAIHINTTTKEQYCSVCRLPVDPIKAHDWAHGRFHK